uniref:toll/interleukin-1 receptor domain-containing protein n=1 Tax=Jannaschia marina TaxID=2741674 RepID=UPI001ABAA444
ALNAAACRFLFAISSVSFSKTKMTSDRSSRQRPISREHLTSLFSVPSGAAFKRLVNETLDERDSRLEPPKPLRQLLPRAGKDAIDEEDTARDVLFLIGSRPSHDDFIMWLGPKLEAQGFQVFSEIMTLEPGTRHRKSVRRALEHRAAKVLVVTDSVTNQDDGVMDLVEKAVEMGAALEDERFVIPLRIAAGVKLDVARDAKAADFSKGWADGLLRLTASLRRQGIPKRDDGPEVSPEWKAFRQRKAKRLIHEPERLISNWVQVLELPDELHFYEASGAISGAFRRKIEMFPFPAREHGQGIVAFAEPHDVQEAFEGVGRLRLVASVSVADISDDGVPQLGLHRRDASNVVTGLLRNAWERHCTGLGMMRYAYSGGHGFHPSSDQTPIGHKVKWGGQDGRRSSMLRNIARGHVWTYGVTAIPKDWPFWHFRMKARVLFAKDNGTPEGQPIDDKKKMHRLRRSGCKGWRNPQWHGRLRAFLEIMSGDSAFIRIALAPGRDMLLSGEPLLFTSPVTTEMPDVADPDGEEEDTSTLGRPDLDDGDEQGEEPAVQ